MIIMSRRISAADLVWMATASLAREQPDRTGFSHDEIRRKANELEPDHGFPDPTIRTHIASHCVANKKPDPGKHRKLFQNLDGTYRLYRPGDAFDPARKDGKLLPDANRIPPNYRELLDWYEAEFSRCGQRSIEEDPILALSGVGKELWRDLGGGETFLRELRETWYESSPKALAHKRSGARKRKAR